jgi:trk system potassium uptake protein
LLLAGLAIGYVVLEWTNVLSPLAYQDRVMVAVFQSASARTAGFNVVDLGQFLPATLVLTCAAMFIGAGPGSTAGGIKVTTFAALFAGLRAELQASPPQLLNRRLPDGVIRKAIGVVFLSLLIVSVVFFSMLLLEPHAPLSLLFEVISAFSTTGLSTGITPSLSTPGKLLITLTMFAGRIGPMTLALALSVKTEQRPVQLPCERVTIG